jgi:hypothetical protein
VLIESVVEGKAGKGREIKFKEEKMEGYIYSEKEKVAEKIVVEEKVMK